MVPPNISLIADLSQLILKNSELMPVIIDEGKSQFKIMIIARKDKKLRLNIDTNSRKN